MLYSDGAHIRCTGPCEVIASAYDSFPWRKEDIFPAFPYKIASSMACLEAELEALDALI